VPVDIGIDENPDQIEAVLRTWLPEIEINPFLGSAYWRQRVCSLMRENHLSPRWPQRADSLLMTLERFDAYCAFPDV
jgi:hypothetical protein